MPSVPGGLPWDWSCGASTNICWNREDKAGLAPQLSVDMVSLQMLVKRSSKVQLSTATIVSKNKRDTAHGALLSKSKAHPEPWAPPQSPLRWFETSHREARDALLLSASLKSTSTGAGAHWRSHPGGLGLLCSHRSFSHVCDPLRSTSVDKNYRGGCSATWGSFLPPLIWQEMHSQKLTQDIHKVLLKLLNIHLNFLCNSWCGFTINGNKLVHSPCSCNRHSDGFWALFNTCQARWPRLAATGCHHEA